MPPMNIKRQTRLYQPETGRRRRNLDDDDEDNDESDKEKEDAEEGGEGEGNSGEGDDAFDGVFEEFPEGPFSFAGDTFDRFEFDPLGLEADEGPERPLE